MKAIIRDIINKAAGGKRDFDIFVPDKDQFGHYSTNLALRLGKEQKKNPMNVARDIINSIQKVTPENFFEKVEAASPGFINFWLKDEVLQSQISQIQTAGQQYGYSQQYAGKKARVEYVSANPTGPLHIGNARGGPLGEVLCKVLERAGFTVLREYIHNDVGSQIEKMGRTLWYWYQLQQGNQTEFPEDGYKGEYLKEVAEAASRNLGKNLMEQDFARLTQFGLDFIFQENLETIRRLRISFDLTVKESDLLSSGKTAQAIEEMKRKNVTKEKDGALWFVPQDEFLEDREAVIIRSNGQPTYFASDIAYHKEKFTSGFDLVVDILGSNHYGHVPKLQALTKLFDFDPNRFVVLLYQYVRVKRGAEVMKMSKRAGTYVTAKEVLDEVGADNMIFFLLMHSTDTHMDFDLALAKEHSMKNPVYYVQYAHVRAFNILQKTKEEGIEINNAENLSRLNTPEDRRLIFQLMQFPEVILETAMDYQVHHLTRYGFELAKAFHAFYEKERVIGEEQEAARARAALTQASLIVIKNLLSVLGVSAPEKM